jgi:phage-related protein
MNVGRDLGREASSSSSTLKRYFVRRPAFEVRTGPVWRKCPVAIAVANMSKLTYPSGVSPKHKPLVWLRGEVKTPPFSPAARVEAGYLLRRLQAGQLIGMPHSRPMPSIGARCHELRIQDADKTWRVIYRVDAEAIVIAEVFSKTTRATPASVIAVCKQRLKTYDQVLKGGD